MKASLASRESWSVPELDLNVPKKVSKKSKKIETIFDQFAGEAWKLFSGSTRKKVSRAFEILSGRLVRRYYTKLIE
jgi:hypothetical protein